jgi:hypothetical protein
MEAVTDHLPGAVKVPAIHNDGDRRDLRLDACRGLALSFIFIDHIPGNSLAWLTLRNYGFSDTTEVFVFVSGYTCMLAYGGALREQGWRGRWGGHRGGSSGRRLEARGGLAYELVY